MMPLVGQLRRAHVEDHLGRALGIGHQACRGLVQRGHAFGFGGERDLVQAGELRIEVCLVQAGLGRGHHQRPFGGIAFDLPATIGFRLYVGI